MRDFHSWWTGRTSTLTAVCSELSLPLLERAETSGPMTWASQAAHPQTWSISLPALVRYKHILWWSDTHEDRSRKEKPLQQLKSASQDLSSVQTGVKDGCGLLPAGFPPYRLLESHSQTHSVTLQSFTEVCLSFLVLTAHEVSAAQPQCRREQLPQQQSVPVPGMLLEPAPGEPSLATAAHGKREKLSGSLLSCSLD